MEFVQTIDLKNWRTFFENYDKALLQRASKLKNDKQKQLTSLDKWFVHSPSSVVVLFIKFVCP